MRRRRGAIVSLPAIVSLAALATPAGVAAQGRASEPATVSQTIGGTTITIDYSRPTARGREELFGGVVHWGETWTPGANWATTLETSAAIRLNGAALPAGKYSVWMVPRREGEWTVILSRESRLFHTRRPRADDEALRVAARPERGAHMESLAWYFPVVAAAGATLRMHWGTTIVPMRITVGARGAARSSGERAPYVGRYDAVGGDGARTDAPWRLEVVEAEGRLRARATPAPPGLASEFDLVPERDERFHPGAYRDGVVVDVHPEILFVFRRDGGRATGFELRAADGAVTARGTRAGEPR